MATDRVGQDTHRLGEIVEASVAALTAQAHRLGEPPALGSIVRTSDGVVDIYAVVYNSATGSVDPGRRFTALGAEEPEESGIYRSHPELAQLLRTDFHALVVGYVLDGKVRQYLPARPARMHAFVHMANNAEVREFTREMYFLQSLAHASAPTKDDALASCVRIASKAHDDREAFLLSAGREIARLLGRDTQRLNAVLRTLRS